MKLKSEMLLEDLRAAHAYMAKLRETLEAVERELEGVRKVEAWLAVNEISRFVDSNAGEYHAMQTMVPTATGPTLAALGHLLPEVPDAK